MGHILLVSPNLRYHPLFTPGPVQNQTQFTNSPVHAKFHRIFRTEMIDPSDCRHIVCIFDL